MEEPSRSGLLFYVAWDGSDSVPPQGGLEREPGPGEILRILPEETKRERDSS
jgi:hypothetical protein